MTMTLGEYLRSRRDSCGLTLEETAAAAGMSKSYVHELENNKSVPSLTIAAALTLVLRADLPTMGLLALRSGVKDGDGR